jgi:hypothetical protein
LLARLGFDRLIADAGYPGSEMVPALRAMQCRNRSISTGR